MSFSQPDSRRTEAEVIRDIALESMTSEALSAGDLIRVVTPHTATGEILDLEKYGEYPRRARGNVVLHTQASFAKVVNEFKSSSTHLYANVDEFTLSAVFNDHSNDIDGLMPGFADHRAAMKLRHTDEWKHWANLDNTMVDQVEFAEHIEDGLDEIREPDAAYVLELAQNFHATTGTTVRAAHRLDSGEIQVAYDQSINATAGRERQLKVPNEIELGIMPFEGTQPYKVKARLRYRLRDGHLSLGYKLIRPKDVLLDAFSDTVAFVSTDTELFAHEGVAPAPR